MKALTPGWLRALFFASLIGVSTVGSVAWAQAEKKSPEPKAAPKTTKAKTVVPVVYNPPVRGNPTGRVGGGTRGEGADRSVILSVLTPEHVGLTTKEQPTLYWYISQPTSHVIELTVIETHVAKPVLEAKLNPSIEPGIQKVQLADYNLRLKPGAQYRWYIAIVTDPKNRSKDILAGGFIEHVALSETLRARLSQASSAEAASAYASEGVWYDALAALSEAIDAAPGDAILRAQRASLLEQVKLQQVAAFDRAVGTK